LYHIKLNNIFLKTFKPRTNSLRFKKKIFNLFSFKSKLKYFFFLARHSNVKGNSGKKLILSKGKINKQKNITYLQNKKWSSDYFVLLNIILVKKKFFGLIKYANGALAYSQITHGFFIGMFNFSSNLPPFL